MTTYNRASLFEIVRPIFGNGTNSRGESKVETGIAIILAESGGRTDVINVNRDGSIDRGPWQINNRAHPDVSNACAKNIVCSTRAAYRISNGGEDFSPWTTYTSGAYKQYLKGGSVPNADSGFLGTGIGSPTGLPNPLDPVKKLANALIDVIQYLFGSDAGAHYLRIGKVLGGLVLILLALKQILNIQTPTIIPV